MSINQGEALELILKEKGISKSQLARNLGVDRSVVYGYLRSSTFQEESLIKISKAINEDSDYIIEKARSLKDNGDIDSDDLKLMNRTKKPYYDIEIFATPGKELIEQIGKVEPEFYISVPHFSDIDFYIRVTGDSMYPKYRHGDIIAVKKMESSAFFAWYEPYVVITRTNRMRLLKYLHPHPEDDAQLLLVSYDKDKFPPQPIARDEIEELYLVKGKIEL